MTGVLGIITVIIFGLATLTLLFTYGAFVLWFAAQPILLLIRVLLAIGKFIQDLFDRKF